MSAKIVATALKDVQRFFEALPDIAEEAAVLAINETVTREGMTLIERDMRQQVNFSASYLDERMGVTRRARPGRLEAVISARDRATSLARFASGQTPRNTRGQPVRVQVRPGHTKILRRDGRPTAFLMGLRNGNTGLALRLPKGQRPRESKSAVMIPSAGRSNSDLWLLYGPSVDQVMRGVIDDRSEDILNIVSKKFIRQFGRLSRAR